MAIKKKNLFLLLAVKQGSKKQLGFTLLELLVVVSLSALLSIATYLVFTFGYKEQQYIQEQNLAVEEARDALKKMVSEIREASDADNGAYPIELAQDNTFIFYSDIDIDDITERVRYFIEEDCLKKGIIEPVGVPLVYSATNEQIQVLSDHLVNSVAGVNLFRYYNTDYPADTLNNPLSTPASLQDLSLVEIRLRINAVPDKITNNEQLDSFVQIRNLKTNL